MAARAMMRRSNDGGGAVASTGTGDTSAPE
jgi:hypothetical protein